MIGPHNEDYSIYGLYGPPIMEIEIRLHKDYHLQQPSNKLKPSLTRIMQRCNVTGLGGWSYAFDNYLLIHGFKVPVYPFPFSGFFFRRSRSMLRT